MTDQYTKAYVAQALNVSEEEKPRWMKSTIEALDKIRDLIDLDEGSEFKFDGTVSGETAGEIDYVYGGLKNQREVTESATGYISIEKAEDGTWEYSTSWWSDTFDVSDSGKGYESLEDLLPAIAEYIEGFDDFELEGLA